jgi:hypothetical protein
VDSEEGRCNKKIQPAEMKVLRSVKECIRIGRIRNDEIEIKATE